MAIKNVKVKLNNAGVGALLASAETAADLEQRGDRIAAAAGPGHRVSVERNSERAIVFVTTDSTEAREAEAERRNLSSSIDAGR